MQQAIANNLSKFELEVDLESEATLAKELIEKYTSWEGDGNWYVSGMPSEDSSDSLPIFAVKQENNGSTFLCSPFPLPWVESSTRIRVIIPDEQDAKSWIVTEDDDDSLDFENKINNKSFYMRILDKGKDYWNQWRQRNHDSRPSLKGAKLAGRDLHGIDFEKVNLDGADLNGADLRGAILVSANLVGADLRGANLSNALLYSANLAAALQLHL